MFGQIIYNIFFIIQDRVTLTPFSDGVMDLSTSFLEKIIIDTTKHCIALTTTIHDQLTNTGEVFRTKLTAFFATLMASRISSKVLIISDLMIQLLMLIRDIPRTFLNFGKEYQLTLMMSSGNVTWLQYFLYWKLITMAIFGNSF